MAQSKMRILITGVSGLLGSNLAYAYRNDHEVLGLYNEHPYRLEGVRTASADILDLDSLKKIIADFGPQVVIHGAALANIDDCEKSPSWAQRLNVEGSINVVKALGGRPIKLVHISTDAVFDGFKGNYHEQDQTNPQNIYGHTKLEAEKKALEHANTLVVRTAFYGFNVLPKTCFGEFVIQELSNRRKINGFTDIRTTFLFTLTLARLLSSAVSRDLKGIYHFACSSSVSKNDFALQIAKELGLDAGLIRPISIDQSPLPAKRGKDLTLSSKRLAEALHEKIPTMEESIKEFCRSYKDGLQAKIKG